MQVGGNGFSRSLKAFVCHALANDYVTMRALEDMHPLQAVTQVITLGCCDFCDEFQSDVFLSKICYFMYVIKLNLVYLRSQCHL